MEQKDEEIGTSIPTGAETAQILALQMRDKPPSSIQYSVELNHNQESLRDGHRATSTCAGPDQQKPEGLLHDHDASSHQNQEKLLHNHSESSSLVERIDQHQKLLLKGTEPPLTRVEEKNQGLLHNGV